MFNSGYYHAAIQRYKEAQEHHGKPSHVLETWIGLAYDSLGEYDMALSHYTNVIKIKDTSVGRFNRGSTYHTVGECDKAIIDAKVALTLEASFEYGFHTDAEANYILSDCYFRDQKYLLSLQHLEAAIAIAKEYQYSAADIEFLEEELEITKSYLE